MTGWHVPWPQDAEQRLVALWNEGKTAIACADALAFEFGFAVTRNGVLGKLHRLRAAGTKLRGDPGKKTAGKKPRTAGRSGRAYGTDFHFGATNHGITQRVYDAWRKAPIADEPPPSNIALPNWPPANTCQWLHGDPAEPEARWCAAPVPPEARGLIGRYCPHHAARVLRHDRERSHFHGA